ncbi:MAG TPA: hypothetical protein VMR14_11500 [Streptosporangiaceae bacterium]|nr:hypothetical protein [Streptosporangiaceae bacterium]
MNEEIIAEWGVRFPNTGDVVECDSEPEARTMAEITSGELVARRVFEASWLEGVGPKRVAL